MSGFCMVLPTITSIGAMLFMDNIHEYRVDFGAMGTLAAWPTPTARATWLWPTYTPGVRQLARRPRPGGSQLARPNLRSTRSTSASTVTTVPPRERRTWTSPGFPETFLSGTGTLGLEGSRLWVILPGVPDSFVLVG